jgi:hypothetical protein
MKHNHLKQTGIDPDEIPVPTGENHSEDVIEGSTAKPRKERNKISAKFLAQALKTS